MRMEEELNELLTDVASAGRAGGASGTAAAAVSTGTGASGGGGPPTSALRNEDFRALLNRKAPQTSASAATPQTPSTHSFSHRQTKETRRNQNTAVKAKKQKEKAPDEEDPDDLGPSNLNEILKNYRDRAEERRRGVGKDEATDELQASNAYRAVPSDVRATADAAQRRKQAIQESKYLGGDMEHTHLVKGLDYSLLHKVRSEIAMREQKGDEALEAQYNSETQLTEPQSDNRMVRNIHRVLFPNDTPIVRNEMFRKGRMAYVVDLEEEDNDLPTTLLRSVHDCPVAESSHDISTSNMLIQKLTQVLSYLRADNLKKKKKGEGGGADEKLAKQTIFDEDGGELGIPRKPAERSRDRDYERRKQKPASYFDDGIRDNDKDRERDRDRERERDRDRDRERDRDRGREKEKRGGEGGGRGARENEREKERRGGRDEEKRGAGAPGGGGDHDRRKEVVEQPTGAPAPQDKKRKFASDTDGYAECYPGGIEMYEAAGESDDDADYSKMDMGNRRGPIKRWDFDDPQDYEKYMESKEAMPKAAYQFGVKTNDGRKTRKSGAERKLDKEFSQISKILEKRKSEGRSEIAKRIRY